MLNPLQKVRNVIRGLVQGYGTANTKKRLWDKEFASGKWNCLEHMDGDCLYPYIEKYANGGSILDLGCGPGATGNELNFESYSSYTGVDISEVALEKARESTDENYRSAKNEYIQADITRYLTTRTYDVIVFGDSIYYIPEWMIGVVLRRYTRNLNAGGVFVMRLKGEYPGILAIVEDMFSVIEKQFPFGPEICILAFRPRRGGVKELGDPHELSAQEW